MTATAVVVVAAAAVPVTRKVKPDRIARIVQRGAAIGDQPSKIGAKLGCVGNERCPQEKMSTLIIIKSDGCYFQ